MAVGETPTQVAKVAEPPRALELVVPLRLRDTLAEVAGMVSLALLALRDFLRSPLTYAADTVSASWIVARRCAIPLALSVFVLGFGALGVEAGVVLDAVGSPDRTGGVYVTAAVREIATWVTAMVVAGVAGTAVCADLGARRIREELDALLVLGVRPTRLIVPWAIALTVVTPLLLLVAIAACVLSGVAAVFLLYDTTVGGFVATFKANFAPPELFAAMVKTALFGAIIATVCCYKGLNAKGGPEGVGRAVNQAVVLSFVALWVVNYVVTSLTLALFPELAGLR
ncbi:ABC transporter permease [Conexibacter sp. SYSU D00693]|uniref:ABC transporter permease n=1 Tax=Conexibacter sp. SYSU D00693 TaxID=2812560 RepID=UPI00196A2AF2|nr:ABC transporter permease [Conexibacter sp. SYSU D00693]